MKNNLASLFGVPKETCLRWLAAADVPEDVRAEQMNLAAFCRLTDVLAGEMGKGVRMKEETKA